MSALTGEVYHLFKANIWYRGSFGHNNEQSLLELAMVAIGLYKKFKLTILKYYTQANIWNRGCVVHRNEQAVIDRTCSCCDRTTQRIKVNDCQGTCVKGQVYYLTKIYTELLSSTNQNYKY